MVKCCEVVLNHGNNSVTMHFSFLLCSLKPFSVVELLSAFISFILFHSFVLTMHWIVDLATLKVFSLMMTSFMFISIFLDLIMSYQMQVFGINFRSFFSLLNLLMKKHISSVYKGANQSIIQCFQFSEHEVLT